MKCLPIVVCFCCMLFGATVSLASETPHPAVVAAQQQRVDAVAVASPPTIAIFDGKGQGGGSGVIITSDGLALTNFHVTAPCGTAMKCGMTDGKVYDAVIVGIDPVGDVALIQLLGRDDFPTAEIADSDQVKVGDWVFAIGNPFLLADDFHPSVSYGIVSGTHRYQYPAGTLLEYTDCIQTDAAINPGNSGGPLFNAQGKLIGINGRGSFEKRGRVNVGVGYAISINQIKHFLGHLKSGRIVDHATLGATVATAEDGSAVVDDILESCDAYRRGLRYGDEIVNFAGREITSANALKNILGVFPRGWTVPMSYRREGETFDIQVRLMGLHDQAQLYDLVQQEGQKPIEPPGGDPPESEEKELPENPKLSEVFSEKPKLPEAIAQRYEARRGFANYWYNLQKQQQLRNLYRGQSADANGHYAWTIRGKLADDTPFEIVTTAENGTCSMPSGRTAADFTQELDSQLSPPGSGGLLVTLHLWQRFLDKGLRQFGEVFYLGQLPNGPNGQLLDCLVGIYAGIEVHFLFVPDTGLLVGIDVFPDEDRDPCELRFDDYGDVAGQHLARRWQVLHAGKVFAELQLEEFAGSSLLFPPIDSTRSQAELATTTATSPVRPEIREAQRRVVKIYGAGGLKEMEAYQSGVLISPNGHVLTMLSYVLDTDDLVAILDDGRKLPLEFLNSDPLRDIAVLRLQADDESFPYFELTNSPSLQVGQRVMALSNLYGIATGDEAVSVLQGVVTAVAPLDARRGAFQANFNGDVYILDAYANNPGAAGGALVNWQGQLLGMLGKELRSEVTGAWLNYALPISAFSEPVADILAGRDPGNTDSPQFVPAQPMTAESLGLRLIPNILSRTPPYLDTVRRGSPAEQAGLRADDLIVFVQQQPVASHQEFFEQLSRFELDEAIQLDVLRDGVLLQFQLQVATSAPSPAINDAPSVSNETPTENSGITGNEDESD
ncbi:MAG: trypsin-like peptidase domain-containing protein [Planctomycetales bacterium]|nr:trypsin-like peptidase domain-containing protein [Planctomycetales bacterium]